VLDLSLFRKGEQVRFMTDFAERLYHRNRQPLQVVLDEADAFAPQRPQHGQERMLGSIEDLVRRGRARGIGVTLVTQRAAVLNKDVLTQVEVLVALRTIAPQDREAIDAWVKVHGTPEQREQLMSSLPSLPIGTAWFWSPGWLDLFQMIKVRTRETFDSSATPKAGAKVAEPKQMADVDLGKLREQIQSTIERAKENDPKELRKQIAELKKQVAAKSVPAPAAAPVKIERVEVPIITDKQIDRLNGTLDRFNKLADHHQALADAFKNSYVELRAAFLEARQNAERKLLARPPAVAHPYDARGAQQVARVPARVGPRATSPAEGVTVPQLRILDALAWLESVGVMQAQKSQLALLAEASPTSSGYSNNLGALRTGGLINYPAPGAVALSEAGRQCSNQPETPPTTATLQAAVLARLPRPKARILEVLINAYPESIDKAELATAAGASATSSGYSNNLGSLRSLGLIEYPQPGQVVAQSILFLEE
jgi:DNA segregation ATPase FtsK/SpoIIIE-like protein